MDTSPARQAVNGWRMAQWIDNQAELEALATALQSEAVLAVDSESNSYFAFRGQVCLLQISTPDKDLLIDTLAGLDFSCLAGVFANSEQRKIFHDAEGDIPALKADLGLEVHGLFDSRVAAGALGESKQGLASQLQKYLQIDVDKEQQLSNWGQRPLSAEQLVYASGDTRYLIALQQAMQAQLSQRSELVQKLFARECLRFENLPARVDRTRDSDAFFHIKGAGKLSSAALSYLRSLYLAREDFAEAQNFPAPRLFPTKLLLQIAIRAGEKGPPKQAGQLASVVLSQAKLRRHGQWILQALRQAGSAAELDVEALKARHHNPRMDQMTGDRFLRLKAWRRQQSGTLHVDPSLLLLTEGLKDLAQRAPLSLQDMAGLAACDSWFVAQFGESLLQALWGV